LRIWIAGLGPQMARLAGRIADGIVINMADPPMIRRIVDDFRSGARDAGRDPDSLEVVSKVRVSLAADPAVARWALKKVLTFYSLQRGYSETLTKMGWGEVVTAVKAAHRSQGFAAARALIPDEMVDSVPMYADRDLTRLPAKLAEYEQAGSTRCIVAYGRAPGDPPGALSRFLPATDLWRSTRFSGGAPSSEAAMHFDLTEDQVAIAAAIREVCARFPGSYWQRLEATGDYPEEFVRTLTELGWLSVLIPEEYGGGGLGITEAGII